jgi:hypothetical protein
MVSSGHFCHGGTFPRKTELTPMDVCGWQLRRETPDT